MSARERVAILISIGAFVTGLSLCRIRLLLALGAVFLFKLLLHQELMLNAQTSARAHLCLLLECELLLKLFGGSTSWFTLFNCWLFFRYAFAMHLLNSSLYSIFHWLGHSGDMLKMRLAADCVLVPVIGIVWRRFACALLPRLDALLVLLTLHLETCSVN